MSHHNSDQMSQRWQVSRVTLWWSSLYVFVFVFVFVYVIVFLLVRSCPLITLIKCLKDHKALGSLWLLESKTWLSDSVSEWVTRSPIELLWTAKKLWSCWLIILTFSWAWTTLPVEFLVTLSMEWRLWLKSKLSALPKSHHLIIKEFELLYLMLNPFYLLADSNFLLGARQFFSDTRKSAAFGRVFPGARRAQISLGA